MPFAQRDLDLISNAITPSAALRLPLFGDEAEPRVHRQIPRARPPVSSSKKPPQPATVAGRRASACSTTDSKSKQPLTSARHKPSSLIVIWRSQSGLGVLVYRHASRRKAQPNRQRLQPPGGPRCEAGEGCPTTLKLARSHDQGTLACRSINGTPMGPLSDRDTRFQLGSQS
ncbi:hypothetical protein NUW54_g6270 [Trametes sanguinea]|uniref:Uncharacterized protein n=1 Tax=Trametes sanguinea TaxID=158606 RepID=A0ACC1PVB0_9APHY|nr:hypothetical protein NUW54_g6270 [Trametes sanguinea]